jgi:hypothetical protein
MPDGKKTVAPAAAPENDLGDKVPKNTGTDWAELLGITSKVTGAGAALGAAGILGAKGVDELRNQAAGRNAIRENVAQQNAARAQKTLAKTGNLPSRQVTVARPAAIAITPRQKTVQSTSRRIQQGQTERTMRAVSKDVRTALIEPKAERFKNTALTSAASQVLGKAPDKLTPKDIEYVDEILKDVKHPNRSELSKIKANTPGAALVSTTRSIPQPATPQNPKAIPKTRIDTPYAENAFDQKLSEQMQQEARRMSSKMGVPVTTLSGEDRPTKLQKSTVDLPSSTTQAVRQNVSRQMTPEPGANRSQWGATRDIGRAARAAEQIRQRPGTPAQRLPQPARSFATGAPRQKGGLSFQLPTRANAAKSVVGGVLTLGAGWAASNLGARWYQSKLEKEAAEKEKALQTARGQTPGTAPTFDPKIRANIKNELDTYFARFGGEIDNARKIREVKALVASRNGTVDDVDHFIKLYGLNKK